MPRINTTSLEWRQVEAEIKRRLDMHCKALEAPGVLPARTEFLRGQIAELRALLEWPLTEEELRAHRG